MKILMINKYFYRFGGAEMYMFNLMEQLCAGGHIVVPFSMMYEKNAPSPYMKYFLPNVDYNRRRGFFTKVAEARRMFYSVTAKQKLSKLIHDTEPAIAHCHNIYHQISPSILHVLREHKIPVVMTAHDYKLLCGNYKMLSHGHICERCCSGQHYHAVLQRCMKDATVPSILVAAEMYLHKMMGIYKMVDTIITPSAFFRNKLIEYGFVPDKVVHIPNFVHIERYTPTYECEDYFIYFGRLVEEKGLKTLLKAMRLLKSGKLLIIGTGPQQRELENIAERYNLRNVQFLGFLTGEMLLRVVGNSMFVVLPSEWYENNPMSVIEAFALGKPVVSANIGGLPELVEDGCNGLLFESGNAEDLAEKIISLLTNLDKLKSMGKAARAKVEQYCNPSEHYEKILAIYTSLCSQN